VFVGLAYYEQGVAESTHAASLNHNITQPMLDQYNAALSSREGFKDAAYGAFGGAVALALGAGALFLFDTPRTPTGSIGNEGPTRKTPMAAPLEVSAVPLAGPGFLGASIVGRF